MAAICLSKATFLAGPSYRPLRKAGKAVNVSVKSAASPRIVAMSTPAKSEVEKKIEAAVETCADPNAKVECAVAWDEVEEVSAAVAKKKQKDAESDPLEEFCDENPEADECRVYSD